MKSVTVLYVRQLRIARRHIPGAGRKNAGQVVKQPADIGYERRGAARADRRFP
jgi:hypothetical protein